jgi:hypothetical protein
VPLAGPTKALSGVAVPLARTEAGVVLRCVALAASVRTGEAALSARVRPVGEHMK